MMGFEPSTPLVVIDNYDSFTWNLVHYLGELGAPVVVYRNDTITPEEVLALRPSALVLSPGPCTPNEAGICLDLIRLASEERVPVLGVCLGHQAIGQAFGGEVRRANVLMHGKTSQISHSGASVFRDLPASFEATRYHSLVVAREGLPEELEVTAWTDDGTIMGLRHRTLPIHGVQFHPESIASEQGHALLSNFLAMVSEKAVA